MKKYIATIAVLFASITFFTSCGSEESGVAEIIEQWHKENGPPILRKASKVNEVTFVKDVTALDSINFLMVRFNFTAVAEREYNEAIKQISASKTLRAKSQAKIDETNAQSIKNYNQRDVDRFTANIIKYTDDINGMIDAIEGNYSGSKHDDLWKSIRRLKKMGDKTIVSKLYTANVSTMSKSRKSGTKKKAEDSYYMLSLDLTKLVYDGHFSGDWMSEESIDIESIHFERIGGQGNSEGGESEEILEEEVIEESTNEVEYYKINDPDGYSNLRDAPKGEVIQKILDTEQFEVIGEEAGYSKVKLSNGIIGYIHSSRVVKI